MHAQVSTWVTRNGDQGEARTDGLDTEATMRAMAQAIARRTQSQRLRTAGELDALVALSRAVSKALGY